MASRNWGFCDLSISKSYDLTKLETLKKMGYNTVAINTVVEETNDEPKKKKKKGETKEKKDYIPLPVEVPKDIIDNSGLNILQRVTIEFSDLSISHKVTHSENIKKYDIIAVIPKTFSAFQYACVSMEVDLISFESETRLPFKINRKLYRQAVVRGIFFELMYSPAIKDSTARKNIINISHIYHCVGKSKNIVVTSNAEKDIHIRTVNDIIHLGFLLGLNTTESLEVIRNNARRLIVKADGRRRGKHFMTISTVSQTLDMKEK